ncbi:MAG: protocatechuate 3,4-dioxygenase subunit beta, partial [Pseudomonadota bacterium]
MTRSGEYYQRDRDRQPPAYTPRYKTSVTRSPKL